MGKIRDNIKTQPYLLSMSQIEIVGENINTFDDKVISKVAEKLKDFKFNPVLPIACLTEKEDKYRLLTGIGIYEAAKKAGFKELWVFLITDSQLIESKKLFEQVLTLSKLNEIVVKSEDTTDFLTILNTGTIKKLCSLKIGIGPKTAPKILDNRPYSSLNVAQAKFSVKSVLRWLKAYKEK